MRRSINKVFLCAHLCLLQVIEEVCHKYEDCGDRSKHTLIVCRNCKAITHIHVNVFDHHAETTAPGDIGEWQDDRHCGYTPWRYTLESLEDDAALSCPFCPTGDALMPR